MWIKHEKNCSKSKQKHLSSSNIVQPEAGHNFLPFAPQELQSFWCFLWSGEFRGENLLTNFALVFEYKVHHDVLVVAVVAFEVLITVSAMKSVLRVVMDNMLVKLFVLVKLLLTPIEANFFPSVKHLRGLYGLSKVEYNFFWCIHEGLKCTYYWGYPSRICS